MIVLGLTGSLAMGKSSAASAFIRLGLPLHDADAAVHDLIGHRGAAVPEIAAAFPGACRDGEIDRNALGKVVFNDAGALRRLESILHPLVRATAVEFLKRQRRGRRRIVVLDIPLLFETGGERLCDAVIVVTAPRFVQEARALSRPGMTREKLAGIRARQLSEREKCRRADFVVQTGRSKGYTFRELRRIVRLLCREGGTRTRGTHGHARSRP